MTAYQPTFPNLVGHPYPDLLGIASVAGTIYGRRVSVPSDGSLHNLKLAHDATAANCRVGVYDTGQATAGSYTLLWDSGTVALSGVQQWQTIGDPNRPVSAGQQLFFAVSMSNNTTTIGRNTLAASPIVDLGTDAFFPWVTGSVAAKLAWSYAAGAFGALPSAITEAQAQTASGVILPCIVGYVG